MIFKNLEELQKFVPIVVDSFWRNINNYKEQASKTKLKKLNSYIRRSRFKELEKNPMLIFGYMDEVLNDIGSEDCWPDFIEMDVIQYWNKRLSDQIELDYCSELFKAREKRIKKLINVPLVPQDELLFENCLVGNFKSVPIFSLSLVNQKIKNQTNADLNYCFFEGLEELVCFNFIKNMTDIQPQYIYKSQASDLDDVDNPVAAHLYFYLNTIGLRYSDNLHIIPFELFWPSAGNYHHTPKIYQLRPFISCHESTKVLRFYHSMIFKECRKLFPTIHEFWFDADQ